MPHEINRRCPRRRLHVPSPALIYSDHLLRRASLAEPLVGVRAFDKVRIVVVKVGADLNAQREEPEPQRFPEVTCAWRGR